MKLLTITFAVATLTCGAARADIRAACAAAPGEAPTIAGISIEDEAVTEGDLPSFRVTSEATGAFMRVYYDAGSEAAARARAACLGAQLPMVERETGDDRRDAEWFSAVFTQDEGYVPPRGDGVMARWRIPVEPDGTLSPRGHLIVVNVLPHEQVHSFQRRASANIPRWLAEGHASWIQHRITPDIDLAVDENQRRLLAEDAASSDGSLNLAQWGSPRPKREAIMRQVTEEDRSRMLADPNFRPTGTFRFGPDDFEGEVPNTSGLYIAAVAVFQGLEARHGADAVRVWMTDLTASSGRITPPALAASIQRHFGESIDELLAEKPLPASPV